MSETVQNSDTHMFILRKDNINVNIISQALSTGESLSFLGEHPTFVINTLEGYRYTNEA